MIRPLPQIGQRGRAVLAVSQGCVEWLEVTPRNQRRYACVELESSSVPDIARAARAARDAAGGKAERCRLTLGTGFIEHTLHSLPALSRKELGEVVHRRVHANSQEEGTPLLYAAQETGPLPESTHSWLALSVQREFSTRLLVELRRRRIRVRAVTATALAALSRLDRSEAEDDAAEIAIAVDRDSVEVFLVSGQTLVSCESLDGNFQEDAHMAAGLLQTLRSVAAFWRKSRGGAGIASVHVLGMDPERAAILEQAIAGVLPEAEVVCEIEVEGEEQDLPLARVSLLEACLRGSSLVPELAISLPPRRSTEILGLALCATALLGGFGMIRKLVRGPQEVMLQEITSLSGQTAHLPWLQELGRSSEERLEAVERRAARAREVRRSGIDYRRRMTELLLAFRGRAELKSVSVSAASSGTHEVSLEATTGVSAVDSLPLIEEIQTLLADTPGFSNVRTNVPTRIEGEGGGLAFSVRVSLEAAS